MMVNCFSVCAEIRIGSKRQITWISCYHSHFLSWLYEYFHLISCWSGDTNLQNPHSLISGPCLMKLVCFLSGLTFEIWNDYKVFLFPAVGESELQNCCKMSFLFQVLIFLYLKWIHFSSLRFQTLETLVQSLVVFHFFCWLCGSSFMSLLFYLVHYYPQ